ncbi:MAG: hypothetical protein OEV43_04105 [Coriobacteriia bacterium]|nr:hypothetical protein [Coriobacteriia bacterium]
MKRFVAIMTCVLLLVALVAPAAAFAGKGNSKTPPGQAKKAGTASEEDGADVDGKKIGKPDKAKGKPAWAASKDATVTAESSEEADADVGKRVGLENAIYRIARNLVRKQEKFGEDAPLPAGLLKVCEKFYGWLFPGEEYPGFRFVYEGPAPVSAEGTATVDPSETPTETPESSVPTLAPSTE